ncbi:heme-binding protein [Paracoccus sp. pheM1]|uniref:GlcG/HbpS family heme-binding protein n=1 Tax=Paracoccus sp. pheM1 TaxID=2831675 RepID=UPI001BDB7C80|nr:heme-binding protein [Paracoccus sp. pheM1]MBT0782772.1 heme-binding protein [Paracoccus sp. pheM1]
MDQRGKASPVEMTPVLRSAPALRLVHHALEHAESRGWSVAVVVVDHGGEALASARMDGVGAPTLGFAADKAFTAATMRRSTRDFCARMNGADDLRAGLANRPRLITWEGGLPILHGEAIVGGIGVSGALGHEDAECAQAGLCRLGLSSGI